MINIKSRKLPNTRKDYKLYILASLFLLLRHILSSILHICNYNHVCKTNTYCSHLKVKRRHSKHKIYK